MRGGRDDRGGGAWGQERAKKKECFIFLFHEVLVTP